MPTAKTKTAIASIYAVVGSDESAVKLTPAYCRTNAPLLHGKVSPLQNEGKCFGLSKVIRRLNLSKLKPEQAKPKPLFVLGGKWRSIVQKLLPFGVIVCLIPATLAEQGQFIAQGSIDSASRDGEGETIGGIGSGLTYDPKEQLYFAVSDRGPGDGTIDYRPRFDVLRLVQSPDNKAKLKIEVLETVLLRDRDGKAMSGLVPEVPGGVVPQLRDGRHCIDPEAIALSPNGTVYIADEYGPMLYEFKRDGTLLRSITPPGNYLPRTAEGTIDFGAEQIVSGRVPNRGFEGLSLSPDGKRATLLLQSGLIQDGGKDAHFTRILVIDLATEQAVAEYAYEISDAGEINSSTHQTKKNRVKQNDLGVSEITTLDDHRFLVLERDNRGADGSTSPKPAIFKSIFEVDVRRATNLLLLPGKPYGAQPGTKEFQPLSSRDKTNPVEKKILLNFALRFGAGQGTDFAAKWEGVALTPPDAHGHRKIVIASDNDFLNPTLQIRGQTIVFPRAKRSLPTTFLLFDLELL